MDRVAAAGEMVAAFARSAWTQPSVFMRELEMGVRAEELGFDSVWAQCR